jgi:hypothetical protein
MEMPEAVSLRPSDRERAVARQGLSRPSLEVSSRTTMPYFVIHRRGT